MPRAFGATLSGPGSFALTVVVAALAAACGSPSPTEPVANASLTTAAPTTVPQTAAVLQVNPTSPPTAVAPAMNGTLVVAATTAPTSATLETGIKVDVGGYQLYVRCRGQGRPTAVFDAGASSGSSVWYAVEPKVAAFTKTCVYDRANREKSDKGPIPNTSRQMVSDLHRLLARVQVTSPVVLIGQSFGGMNVGLFARLYPDEVARRRTTVGCGLADAQSGRARADRAGAEDSCCVDGHSVRHILGRGRLGA